MRAERVFKQGGTGKAGERTKIENSRILLSQLSLMMVCSVQCSEVRVCDGFRRVARACFVAFRATAPKTKNLKMVANPESHKLAI
jgi:hypothetical protein